MGTEEATEGSEAADFADATDDAADDCADDDDEEERDEEKDKVESGCVEGSPVANDAESESVG
jgi:hypothetical protein